MIGPNHYQHSVGQFGLAIAPSIFTKVISIVVVQLRWGISSPPLHPIFLYLDNWLLVGRTHPEVIASTSSLLHHLAPLEISVNMQKSTLIPTQTLYFKGVTFNSVRAKAYLPMDRFQAINSLIDQVMHQPSDISPDLFCLRMYLSEAIHQIPPFLPSCLASNNVYTDPTQHEHCSNSPPKDKGLSNFMERSCTSVPGYSFPIPTPDRTTIRCLLVNVGGLTWMVTQHRTLE